MTVLSPVTMLPPPKTTIHLIILVGMMVTPIVKKKISLSAMNTIPATRSAMIRAGTMGGMPVTMTDWPMDIRMPMMRVTMLDIQTVLMNTINALLVL